ncbi:hypothetical protein Z043_102563 [Scleropages formosus]|uniref:Methyltransferase type 11 domain-containing protein n=1 Tax=Scleropages formosus TaxID=113540 RepID=A0A0P7ZAN2_SCLFO|nr:hypothetical protein Z043_102563 [Scleropages formosus]
MQPAGGLVDGSSRAERVSSYTLPHFIDAQDNKISRVLKPGGRFISITFAQPHFRRRLLARREYGWSVQTHSYGVGFQYFLYVLTKGETLNPEDQALEDRLMEDKEPRTVVHLQEPDSEDFLSRIGI